MIQEIAFSPRSASINVDSMQNEDQVGHKKTTTVNRVRIIPLCRLSAEADLYCKAVREEAGRCWTAMVEAHVASHGGKWQNEGQLKVLTKGQYALHSQSIQALAEKLIANVDTARTLRVTQPDARYPYKSKNYQTVTWKASAIRVKEGVIRLANGRGQKYLYLPLGEGYLGDDEQDAKIVRAELTWRANHYELCVTLDMGWSNPKKKKDGKVLGVDLGEVHVASATTETGETLIISGRELRSVKRLRNKRRAALTALIDKCQDGSRRKKEYLKQRSKASALFYRQQRDILHKASRELVDFCLEHDIRHIAFGDVRDIADGVNRGSKTNQKIAQWPHGQFRAYVKYKAAEKGITTGLVNEAYSTKTCCHCGHVRKSSPNGRVYRCTKPDCRKTTH